MCANDDKTYTHEFKGCGIYMRVYYILILSIVLGGKNVIQVKYIYKKFTTMKVTFVSIDPIFHTYDVYYT